MRKDVGLDELEIARRANRYVDACFDLAKALIAMAESNSSYDQAGVPWRLLERHMTEGKSDEGRRWTVNNGLLVRSAINDLATKAISLVVKDAKNLMGPSIPRELRPLVQEPAELLHRLALPDLESDLVKLLHGIRGLSFADSTPDHVPPRLVRHQDLNYQLNGGEVADEDFFREYYNDVQWLLDKGYLVGNYLISSYSIRISLAGIVWVRGHEQAMNDEVLRQQRVQVNIDNTGTIYAISTGTGSIHQVIAQPVQPGNWDSLERALSALQVSEERIAELSELLDEQRGNRSPGWLKRWAEGSVTEMMGSLGATMMLAAGFEGVQTLMQLVSQYRS